MALLESYIIRNPNSLSVDLTNAYFEDNIMRDLKTVM